MKIKVNEHMCSIIKVPINEKEINISKCEFEFAESITDEFVKEAYFTKNGETYKQIISNNECDIPSEVLEEYGQIEVGVVAYLIRDGEYVKRYNPQPAFFNSWIGSLKDNAKNSQPITPSEMEQFEQQLEDGLQHVGNIDIDAIQLDNGASITITNKNAQEKTVYVYNGKDGAKGEKGDKGDKGDKGNTGEKGDKGEQGIQGKQGEQGLPGKDGTNGQDGYTPIRGVDYWTSTDVNTIENHCDSYVDSKIGYINQTLATLSTPTGGGN